MTTMFGSGDPDKYYWSDASGNATEVDKLYWVTNEVYAKEPAVVQTLYMVGRSNSGSLYSIDTSTGIATRGGRSLGFVPFALGVAGGVMYSSSHEGFYSINVDSSVATLISARANDWRGLAGIGDTLYGVRDAVRNLQTIDVSNGTGTVVNSRLTNFGVTGINFLETLDLAPIGNTIYMIANALDSRNNNFTALFGVDSSTGRASRIGSNNLAVTSQFLLGLGAIGDTLYITGWGDDALFTISTTDGTLTRVGSARQFGVGENFPSGLAAYPQATS